MRGATVPTSARMAALMGSGRVGHAATRAARSASGMSPSLRWSLHPALHPESALGVTSLCGLGLHRGFTGLSIPVVAGSSPVVLAPVTRCNLTLTSARLYHFQDLRQPA
jgi:hypothetical protein